MKPVAQPTTRINWWPGVPGEVRKAFEAHLARWAGFIPSWCRELIVRWDDGEDDDADLTTYCVQEYRWARITIYPSWLNRGEDERSEEVLHELLHIQLEPLKNALLTMIAQLKERQPDLEPWAKELRRHAEESTICDLTWAIAGTGRVAGLNAEGMADEEES